MQHERRGELLQRGEEADLAELRGDGARGGGAHDPGDDGGAKAQALIEEELARARATAGWDREGFERAVDLGELLAHDRARHELAQIFGRPLHHGEIGAQDARLAATRREEGEPAPVGERGEQRTAADERERAAPGGLHLAELEPERDPEDAQALVVARHGFGVREVRGERDAALFGERAERVADR